MNTTAICRALLCMLICLSVLLCACSGEKPAAPSAPPSAPANKADQFLAAMDMGDALLMKVENTFGAPVFSVSEKLSSDGTLREVFTLRSFSAMGMSLVGSHPLRLETETANLGGITHTQGTLSAAGDTVPFESVSHENGQYIHLPQIHDGAFSLTVSDQEPMSSAELDKTMDDLQQAFRALLTEEIITATKKDSGTEYQATLDEAAWSQLKQLLDQSGLTAFLGLEDLLDTQDIQGQGEAMSMVLTVFASDNAFSLHASLQAGNQSLLKAACSMIQTDKTLSLDLSILHDGASLLEAEGSLTAETGRLAVKGSVSLGEYQLEADVTLTTDSTKAISAAGTLTVTLNYGGITMSVPMSLQGEAILSGENISYSLSISASIPGILEISASYTGAFASGTPEIPQLLPGTTLTQVDIDTLLEQLRTAYPNAMELYDTLLGQEVPPQEDISSLTYRDETGSLVLCLYSDDTLGLSLQGSYTMAEGMLTLSYGEHLLFSVPYTANENDTYTMWGSTFTYYSDNSSDSYTYLSADGRCWIELMPIAGSTNLMLMDICLPVETTENLLEVQMPDGSVLSLPYTVEDRLSMHLWDIPLQYATVE